MPSLPIRPRIIPPGLKKKSRKLRRESTGPERVLWSVLRRKQLDGLRFRRQQVIGSFIVDFYCSEHRLAVEVDGETHVGQGGQDAARTREIERHEVRVIRFTNDEVIHELEAVCLAILRATGRDPEAPRK